MVQKPTFLSVRHIMAATDKFGKGLKILVFSIYLWCPMVMQTTHADLTTM